MSTTRRLPFSARTAPASRAWHVTLAVAGTTLVGCQRDGDGSFVAPQVAGLVRWDADGVGRGALLGGSTDTPHPAASTVLWRADGVRLATDLPLADLKAVLGSKVNNKELVMVRLPHGSRLAREVHDDASLTLAYAEGASGHTDFALVAPDGPDALTWLAGAAHAQTTADGHACGAAELLTLRADDSDAAAVIPPVYLETVALPSLTPTLEQPTAEHIATTISTLEGLGTRHHRSTTGASVPDKVKGFFETAAGGKIAGMTVELVPHTSTPQSSVRVVLPGASDDATTVVLGAHLDSINRNGLAEPAPGADDDASGVATLVETLRVIAASNLRFARRVELIAYAGEEEGLRGSIEIANAYADAGRRIAAAYQLDMNSWASDAGSHTIYLVQNDTDRDLRRAVADLAHTYLGGDVVEKSLTSGTSDHRSWTRAGFRSVFPFEDPLDYNEALHTPNDTSQTINDLALSRRFTQLTLAFLAHEAGLVGAESEATSGLKAFREATPKDLRLAIAPSTAQPGAYDVSVATPATVTRVDLCTTSAAGSLLCTAPRLASVAGKARGARSIFLGEAAATLAAGTRLAIFGYDASGKIAAARSVRLDAK
jgi:hypothetical protein